MTQSKLTTLIDEAIELGREIEERETRLKEIKSTIVAVAEASPEEHEVGDGGGTLWKAPASDGCECRVSFPVPSLKSSLKASDKALPKAKELAGKLFDTLFKPELVYKPADGFRDLCKQMLTTKSANALLKVCTSKTSPKVSFETKETA